MYIFQFLVVVLPRPLRYGLAMAGCLLLAACEGKLSGVSDPELQDRMYECDSTLDQSPGMAISCDNYRRECRSRRDEGRFVC